MPRKGYVGIEVTPRRKMLLTELMQQEEFAQPAEALDFALAFAQKFVKVIPEIAGEEVQAGPFVPDYINYYVGDATSLTDAGTVGPLAGRSQVGRVTATRWRLDAIDTLRNYEQTSMTLTDAIDFALTSYIMHARIGAISQTERDEIKLAIRANQLAFRSELTQFRRDNMEQQERDARMNGTKQGKNDPAEKRKKSGKKSAADKITVLLATMEHTLTGCESCRYMHRIHIEAEQIAQFHKVGAESDIKYVDANGQRVEQKQETDDALPF